MKRKQIEAGLQDQITQYISYKYPKVLWKADLNGLPLSKGLAVKVAKQKSDPGYPDLEILHTAGKKVLDFQLKDGTIERNVVVFTFAGLFLEVKKETPYKLNGELKKQMRERTVSGIKVKYDHLQEQNEMHKRLTKQGYMACFVWSFVQAVKIIDDYMDL